jgi:hypothetical protein
MFRAVQGSHDLRYFPWLIRDGAQNGTGTLMSKGTTIENSVILANSSSSNPVAGVHQMLGPAAKLGPLLMWLDRRKTDANCRVVSVQNRDPQSLVLLVGKVILKRNGEETFQKLLAKIDSRIKKVRIDSGQDGNQVVVDIGLSELLPLAQVGQGVYRLATILADIIGEKTDVLLIDEIENGLHHSVQKQVWTGLAVLAKELNVQIFATTHSGECLHAAHRAFLERDPYDLGVIQLFRTEEGVQGRLLDKEKVSYCAS